MGDDYRYHFDEEAKRRILDFLKDQSNSGVQYRGKVWKWDTVALKKTEELGRFLLEKSQSLGFTKPYPNLVRHGSLKLRKRISKLTESG
ncbi:MAG: hypothetical protein QW828_08575 [Candidatus Bathyarchaeia archaeon]